MCEIKEVRLCRDQDCPKCGFPEIVLVINDETGDPIRFDCSSRKCDWTADVADEPTAKTADPNVCPFCGYSPKLKNDPDLCNGGMDSECDDSCFREMTCPKCGRMWLDVFAVAFAQQLHAAGSNADWDLWADPAVSDPRKIVLAVKGGAVEVVKFPTGWGYHVEVRDYDTEGGTVDEADLKTDADGDTYTVSTYTDATKGDTSEPTEETETPA